MKFHHFLLAALVAVALPACDGEKKVRMKRASTYEERGFSIDSGPEYSDNSINPALVTVLKHRKTGRRFILVEKNSRIAIAELR